MRGEELNDQDRTMMEGYADNIDMLVVEVEIQHRLHAEFRLNEEE